MLGQTLSLPRWKSFDLVVVANSEGGSLETCAEVSSRNSRRPSPQFNGAAEHALGLIEMAAMAGRIQAGELFPGMQLPHLRRCGLKRPSGRGML